MTMAPQRGVAEDNGWVLCSGCRTPLYGKRLARGDYRQQLA